MSRAAVTTVRVDTPFRAMYVHVHRNMKGEIIGGAISHKGKQPDSTIAELVESLSKGLNEALQK